MSMIHPTRRAARKVLVLAIASGLLAALPLHAKDKEIFDSAVGRWQRAKAVDGIERLVTPGINRKKAEAEDIARFDRGDVPHYAVPMKRQVTTLDHGTWDDAAPGMRRWRLRIASPGANSINLGFTRYELPDGAELRLLDAKGKQPFRAFTAADNDAHGQLWTPLVLGNEVLVELLVPESALGKFQLELGSINHGYRLPGEQPTYMKSGSCNVDTICPEGDGWRNQIQSSAVISTGGSTFCSGSLINNATNDKTPYFLTAAHCNINAGNAASLVTFWNFQNSTCRVPGSGASGGAGDGTLTQFNTGSIFRSASAASDFTLVELDDPIDPAIDPFWSGWDRAAADPTTAVAIHHPNTDEKRISFENDATSTTSYLGNTSPGDGTHIRVLDWDLGTTEGGSSGSPLYDQNQRVVGQLHGGFAACGNDDADWYGRLSVSWTGGGTNATRLSNWLDPTNSGLTAINGVGAAPFTVSVDPASAAVCASAVPLVIDVDVSRDEPAFADPVGLAVTGVPANASGVIAAPSAVPPSTTTLTLSDLDQAAPGNYTIDITGTAGADSSEASFALSLATAAPAAPVLTSPANGAGSVSTAAVLSWQAAAQASTYAVEVDDDADFSSPEFTANVATTSVTATGLAAATTYFWRVSADNACDESPDSAAFSFTTGTEYCSAAPVVIPDNVAAGVSSDIVIPAGVTIADLDVGLDITHTWAGDLVVRLTRVGGGPNVAIFDRPGVPASVNGCNGNDPDIVLDDEGGAGAVETSCTSGTNPTQGYIDGARHTPNNPLSAFDGSALGGTWRLTISDNAGADLGTLNEWCLFPSGAPAQTVDAINDAYNATEDTPLPVATPGVLSNDVATGGTPTAAELAQPPNGAVVVAANGGFTYTPDANFCGTDAFTYTATNGAATDTATVTLTVACSNDAPVFTSEPYAFSVNESASNGTVVGSVTATDVESAVTYSITAGNTGGAFAVNAANGQITVASSAAVSLASSPFALTLQASDGTATDTTAVQVTVNDVNSAPVGGTLPDVAVLLPAAPVSIATAGGFTDPDGDDLDFSATGLPASLSIDAETGVITGTPTAAEAGNYMVQVTANDPALLTAVVNFTLRVQLPSIFAHGFED